MRARDLDLERRLTALAAQAAGFTTDGDLGPFADGRAHPGGVRETFDAKIEIAEELADARNYCVWGIERVWDGYIAGDAQAASEYSRYMACLVGVVTAWHALFA